MKMAMTLCSKESGTLFYSKVKDNIPVTFERFISVYSETWSHPGDWRSDSHNDTG